MDIDHHVPVGSHWSDPDRSFDHHQESLRMISAHEARSLVQDSDASLKILLDALDKPIRDAATAGRRSIDVELSHVGVGVTSTSHPRWNRLGEKLQSLGYRMSVESRQSSPRLGSMDDEPIEYDVLVLYW